MYPLERVKWWLERTKDKSHQEAYDKIVERIPKKGKRLIDIGCGTGELLKRVYQNTKYQFYIGADATEEMIELARENLEVSGIQARVVSNLGRALIGKKRIVLFLDEIANSRIPMNYADTTTITFPNFMFKLEDNLYKRLEWDKHPFSKKEKAFLEEVFYRASVKKTKLGGTLVIAAYDVMYEDSEKEEETLADKLKPFHLLRGLKLENHEFFESPEVWTDTNSEILDGEIPGYRIFISTRIK